MDSSELSFGKKQLIPHLQQLPAPLIDAEQVVQWKELLAWPFKYDAILGESCSRKRFIHLIPFKRYQYDASLAPHTICRAFLSRPPVTCPRLLYIPPNFGI